MPAAEINNASTAVQSDQRLVAGRYRLQERIGSGRLGDIFSAVNEDYESLGVEQHVAIQIVSDIVAQNNMLFNKLKAGYETLRAAAHPNVVHYETLGRDGKFVYLAMEYLDGASLRHVLGETETVPLEEVLPVLRAVGEAVQRLHAEDLVHGNLTAGNVFITEGLEVRLLDVVPLDAANAIFRGSTMRDASGHATAEDDVYALACLAYQMLSGKHPFNHSTPAKARLAGLEPDRIPALDDRQWGALRSALALDAEQRTTSVSDFMSDFGVIGTERLRPSPERPVEKTRAPSIEPVESAPEPAPTQTPTPAIAHPPIVVAQPERAPVRRRPSLRRSVLLLLLLASLGAWYSYGEPEENFVELIGFIDRHVDLDLTALGENDDLPVILPAPPAAEIVVAPVASQEPEPAPASKPEAEAEAEPEPVTASPAESKPEPVGASLPTSEPEPTTPVPEIAFTTSYVTVSERDPSARVTLERNGDPEQTLVWWTSEHTARADTDFIPVPRQAANTASGDVLLISLVNDNLPELDESFFVNVGFRAEGQGAIEQVATIRVDIVDDDLR
jgi:hypothetical protein